MVKRSPLIEKIDAIIRPTVENMGYALVRIRLQPQRGRQVLQIMAEPSGDVREMTVEDCAEISRHISALMDVEDPISSAYNLEVSSPGIDRPLVTAEDFARFTGYEASVELEWPQDGRKRFKGQIVSVEQNVVALKLDEANTAELNVDDMQQAKLVLTDALIRMYMEKRKAQADANANR